MASSRFLGVILAWLVILGYWLVKAFDVKTTARPESYRSRFAHLAPLMVAGVIMARPLPSPLDALNRAMFSYSNGVLIVADVLLAAGVVTTLWARRTLGRNWSIDVMQKVDHELIEDGPFRYVRHPIYTGFLLTFLASALIIDQWRCVLATAIAYVTFVRKYRLEEEMMLQLFGERYMAYRLRVPALVPALIPARARGQ